MVPWITIRLIEVSTSTMYANLLIEVSTVTMDDNQAVSNGTTDDKYVCLFVCLFVFNDAPTG